MSVPTAQLEAAPGCIDWHGRTTTEGYGICRSKPAHRHVYVECFGSLADGLVLHHTCGNRRCINPAHLQPLTPAEHSRLTQRLSSHDHARERRMVRRGRERGGWVYVPMNVLIAAGIDPDEPPPLYRTVGRPHSSNTGRVLVSLRRDAS